jgi:hypothetical protein
VQEGVEVEVEAGEEMFQQLKVKRQELVQEDEFQATEMQGHSLHPGHYPQNFLSRCEQRWRWQTLSASIHYSQALELQF